MSNVHNFEPSNEGAAPLPDAAPAPDQEQISVTLGERIAKLEGIVETGLEGVRHGQNLVMGTMGILAAITVAGIVYIVTRIDNIPNDTKQTAAMVAQVAAAAKQPPPQVLLVPAPKTGN